MVERQTLIEAAPQDAVADQFTREAYEAWRREVYQCIVPSCDCGLAQPYKYHSSNANSMRCRSATEKLKKDSDEKNLGMFMAPELIRKMIKPLWEADEDALEIIHGSLLRLRSHQSEIKR